MIELSYRTDLNDSEIEEIIEKYYSEKSEYTKNFIRQAIRRYGDVYDYSKTNRVDNNLTKVIITCPTHGDFSVDPQYFLKSQFSKGCPECFPTTRRQIPTDKFMENLHKIFPQYEEIEGKTRYVNNRIDIDLHCNIHNLDFKSRPANLLFGKCGCPGCIYDNASKARLELAKKKFEKDIVSKFEKEYEFGEYHGAYQEMDVRCKKHDNVFHMSPEYMRLLIKQGQRLCPECREEDYTDFKTKRFIEKCEKRYPGRFDYSEIKYTNSATPVEGIRCKHCGKLFSIYPTNFLQGHGCPKCNQSEGEIHILEWANENLGKSIKSFEAHKKFSSDIIQGREENWGVEIDFVMVSKSGNEYWIEYSGEQHYVWCQHFHSTIEKFNSQVQRDENVRKYCLDNDKILIEIPWTFPREEIKSLLTKVIVDGENPKDLIAIPEISYNRIKSKEDERR